MQLNEPVLRNKGQHLTLSERIEIQSMNRQGFSNRHIAKCLGRSHSTINNEIKRGTAQQVKLVRRNAILNPISLKQDKPAMRRIVKPLGNRISFIRWISFWSSLPTRLKKNDGLLMPLWGMLRLMVCLRSMSGYVRSRFIGLLMRVYGLNVWILKLQEVRGGQPIRVREPLITPSC